ncbi:TonB-dependent receptor [Flammeovirga aprica]|uniref:TonB-dependent receptor n=1 Tax=Flammeovirga aprica JL-4 TaxID=694437 RepID=A0A7X9RWR7_9BACT|nr:TonB-dependent receptor [Flammeovirga aprica]NME70115.1 TonB-dependent receptor [Flammeovirga aprica JL-4]
MKKFLFLIFLTSIGLTSWAQKGTISGTVLDADTGEEIIGASVIIKGTNTGASTDIYGQFSFLAEAGQKEILATFIGYKTISQSLNVVAGQNHQLKFTLEVDAQELDAVEIVAKANTESAEALMVQRKNADVMIESIGAEEMSVKGVSDVEGAMTKMTGVAKVRGKGLYVRGLGDRYNIATMNGLPVPSTNPDLKVIPLSIFPTDLVKNIGVSKTATPELYGDFAGANIDITLKDYPDDAFFTIGISGAYNTLATFNEFKTHNDGQYEALGFNGNARQRPEGGVPTITPNGEPGAYNTSWSPTTSNAPLNIGLNASGGKSWDIGDESVFGIIGSLAHSNKYEYRDGRFAAYNAQATPYVDYDREEWIYSTNTSALLNLTFEVNNKHKFKLNNIVVNESFNSVDENYGYNNDLDTETLFARRNTYLQNTIFVNQFSGDHKFMENDRLHFTWGVSRTATVSQEPDRRQLLFSDKSVDGKEVNLFSRNAFDNHRYWGEMNEVEYAARTDVSIGLGAFDNANDGFRSTLRFGYQMKSKNREFEWFQTNIRSSSAVVRGINSEDPNARINEWIQNETIFYSPFTIPNNYFQAKMDVHSFYTGYDYDIMPNKLKMNVGVRTEIGEQYVKYKMQGDLIADPYREDAYESVEFLPSFNLKYSLDERSNMRFAASKTITRPGMRELIPFEYQTVVGGEAIIGNPNLKNAQNYNVDLKYEIFPNSGELFSVGLFGKYLDNPIEKVARPSAGNVYSFDNIGTATVAGIEIEFEKSLGSIINNGSEALRNTTIGMNGTFMYSQMTIADDINTIVTNRQRALQGASPYIVNANVGYQQDWNNGNINSIFTLTYTTFGDRIFAAGAMGAGDIYEKSFGTLDLIVRNKIKDALSFNVSAKNLLNPSIERYQKFEGGTTKQVSSYKLGMELGVGISCTF